MGITSSLRRAAQLAVGLPGINGLGRALYERQFARLDRKVNLFRGVFASRDEAARSAPRSERVGYDHPEPAAMYRERARRLEVTYYPAMFWLSRYLQRGALRIFDLGGHFGVSYYAFQRYLDFPHGLRWCVYDVAAVVAQGREWAQQEDPSGRLSFTIAFDDLLDQDVILAFGSLQYVEAPLPEMLARLPIERLPARIIVNQMPVHPSRTYYTLQNIGTAFCPYRIECEPAFLQGMGALGYRVIDRWESREKALRIGWDRDFSLDHYTGFCFERDGVHAP